MGRWRKWNLWQALRDDAVSNECAGQCEVEMPTHHSFHHVLRASAARTRAPTPTPGVAESS